MEPEEAPPPYLVRIPKAGLSPFVFAAPHSGRFYPSDFTARATLKGPALRQSEDAFVDQLFEGVGAFGGTQLIATHARAYLDLNRAANELDPTMFSPRLEEGNLNQTHRVRAGLGLIPGIIAEGVPIYSAPLPAREAEKRYRAVHAPYHAKLRELLAERRARFGVAFLVDCHSMPGDSTKKRGRQSGPEIVLGDCWGSACDREFTSLAEELFLDAGFRVRRNVPYSGGYSTTHYGAPNDNIHALQIEISRSLYMDEKKQTPLADFDRIKAALLQASENLVSRTMKRLSQGAIPRAAE